MFSGPALNPSLAERVAGESHTRLYLAAKNILRRLDDVIDDGRADEAIDRLMEYLSLYPVDLLIGIMKDIKPRTNGSTPTLSKTPISSTPTSRRTALSGDPMEHNLTVEAILLYQKASLVADDLRKQQNQGTRPPVQGPSPGNFSPSSTG